MTTPCTDCPPDFDEDDKTILKSHQIVDDISEVYQFRYALVTVRNENAVYHTDSVGNVVCVSRNPLFIDGYTPTVGEYKQLVIYDFANSTSYVFDANGDYKTGALA